ncbi:MAG TPA: hypothetical protein VGE30_01045 [Candidatus Saccharimonadales bacterium]
MSRPRLHRSLIVLGMLGIFLVPVLSGVVTRAAELVRTSPNPASSNPDGSHVFLVRKNPDAGRQRNVYVTAYYSVDMSANWNDLYVRLTTGGDRLGSEDICATAGPATNRYMKVTLDTSAGSKEYYIARDQMCREGDHMNRTGTNAGNIFYGQYDLPAKPLPEPNTNNRYYKVNVSIEYVDPTQRPVTERARFVVNGPVGNPKIGPRGGSFAFSVISPQYMIDNRSVRSTNIRVPFAMECNENGTKDVRVGVYDSDNGAVGGPGTFDGNEVTYKIYDLKDNTFIKMRDPDGGFFRDNRETFRPDAGNDAYTSVAITMEEGHKYEIRVFDVNGGNTIDVRVPRDTIFGDPDLCKERWRIVGKSDVAPTTATRGQTVRFTHSLENKGADRSDTIAGDIYWGPSGRNSGLIRSTNKSYAANGENGDKDSWPNDYVIPDNAQTGWKYCQEIRWKPTKWDDNSRSRSTEACVEVDVTNPPECTPPDPRCPVAQRNVILTANVSGGGDTETQGTANFTGSINVRNYPTPTDGGWGYNSNATEVFASRTTAQINRYGTISSQSRTTYSCPSGYSGSPTSYSYTSCSRTVTTQNSCVSPYVYAGTQCVYTQWTTPNAKGVCPSGYSAFGPTACYRQFWYTPGTTTQTYYSYPNALTEYNYFCAQNNTWTGWTTGGSTCNDYYVCPGGTAAGAGWARSPYSITCNSWECRYQASPFDSTIYVQTTAPKCEWRCAGLSGNYPGIVGARPYLASGVANKTGTGELRCFMQPVFDLTCYWDTGTTTTARVTGEGNFCATATTKPAGAIGTVVCATLQSRAPTGWLPSSPQPGVIYRPAGGARVHTIWNWQRIAGSGCTNVVGMPYLKVYGGDVRVGGGVGGTTGVCESNNSAGIQTRNQGSPGYAGSGTQFAAISNGFINQFVSGQYNNLATNPNPGTNPTKLSFANNAGGSGYGGGFASSGPCYDYVGRLPADVQESTGNTVVNGRVLGAGSKTVQHIRGNAYITSDIVYTGSWTTSASIPLFQLVVEGNIYIDDSVTQLDGIYAAIATNSSTGNIYTCSFVSGASATVPNQTFLGGSSNCKRQLVVNGALAAKKIHFLRDCGSLRWGAQENPEQTTYTGGSNEQTCGSGNHAAEVINYTPESWIRSSAGSGGNKYDSINSLPPIL